jgi:hypothetical protein
VLSPGVAKRMTRAEAGLAALRTREVPGFMRERRRSVFHFWDFVSRFREIDGTL